MGYSIAQSYAAVSPSLDNYTAMPYNEYVEFIEAPHFTKRLDEYMDDAEYSVLQLYLVINPETAPIIPGSGGVRKMRWRGKGKGKRGGLRIIYYWQKSKSEIWMLTLFAKNEAENIPLNILREIRKEIEK